MLGSSETTGAALVLLKRLQAFNGSTDVHGLDTEEGGMLL